MPFHVTPVANLSAILAEGLQPRIGPRSALLGEGCPAVYLFRARQDVEDALMGWLGDAMDEQELAIIQVGAVDSWRLPGAKLGEGADYELVVLHAIPVSAIEALFDECWSPLQYGAEDVLEQDFAP